MAANNPSFEQRREIHYSGRVQGVGFRYTARRIAARQKATGFVQNLPDGRVLVVVEGLHVDVERFLNELEHEMHESIADKAVTSSAATGEFSGFDIRF